MMIIAGVLMWAGGGQYFRPTMLGMLDISYIVMLFGTLSFVGLVITKHNVISYAFMIGGALVGFALMWMW